MGDGRGDAEFWWQDLRAHWEDLGVEDRVI